MSKLPTHARCDGLLPIKTRMPNGDEGVLWAIDCPKRESCVRYLLLQRDMNAGEVPDNATYVSHFHAKEDDCPDYVLEPETI